MSRAAVMILAALALSFCAGWKVAVWQRDSIDLVIERSTVAISKEGQRIASESARKLEGQLDEIRNAPPREIRTELVQPVFTNRCLSDEFVSMYNDATARIEGALSGKPESTLPRAAATPGGNAGK